MAVPLFDADRQRVLHRVAPDDRGWDQSGEDRVLSNHYVEEQGQGARAAPDVLAVPREVAVQPRAR
jgi:hypothetical protein